MPRTRTGLMARLSPSSSRVPPKRSDFPIGVTATWASAKIAQVVGRCLGSVRVRLYPLPAWIGKESRSWRARPGDHEPPHRTYSSAAEVAAARLHRFQSRAALPEARHLGVPCERRAQRVELPLERRHQAFRRQVAVLGIVDRPRDVHAHPGLAPCRLLRVEHLGGNAQGAAPFCGPGLLFEGVLGLAEEKEPLLLEPEVVPRQRRELLEAGAALEAQVTQQGRASLDVLAGGRAPEADPPGEQIAAQARLDVERRLGVQHPFEAEGHHPGCGEGHEVAGHHHSRIAERAAVSRLGAALEDRDPLALPRAVVGGPEADRPPADDDHCLSHAGLRKPATGARSGTAWTMPHQADSRGRGSGPERSPF